MIKILGIYGFVSLERIQIEEMGYLSVQVLMILDTDSEESKKMEMGRLEHLFYRNISKNHSYIRIESLTLGIICYLPV